MANIIRTDKQSEKDDRNRSIYQTYLAMMKTPGQSKMGVYDALAEKFGIGRTQIMNVIKCQQMARN